MIRTNVCRHEYPRVVAACILAVGWFAAIAVTGSPQARALDSVNPVEVPLNGHPANSGFLVFVENDISLNSDESEGTMAAGGDLTIGSNYNIAAGAAPARPTFTAPGDSGPTYLYVGGGVTWSDPGATVFIENQGFTKVADTDTYSAYNTDNNGADVNYRLVPNGQPYNSSPLIDGRTHAETPASIGAPVPASLIDIPGAFDLYRDLTAQMGACAQTVDLTDTQGDSLPRPIASGSSGRVTLVPGQTNVLNLTTTDLANLSEITFVNQPTAATPILINVTGNNFVGTVPNLAGVSGSQAPYMMWNFPQANTVTVTGGATIEGTLYASNAVLTWLPTQNIEGNIIAATFNHGQIGRGTGLKEVHDFPFATTLSCDSDEPTAHLTLVKEVTNDNGGTAEATDWTLGADGPTPIDGTTGSAAITGAAVTPGDYILSEAGPGGYDASEWICTDGDLTIADGVTTLTLADGDNATCTIQNDDTPPDEPTAHLTLVKRVINDDGGTAEPTDWTLSGDGPTPLRGVTGSADVTGRDVIPGTYTLDESGPQGYEAADWTCDAGSLRANRITLSDGERVTCTVVNDDRPDSEPTPTNPTAVAPAAESPPGVLPDTGGPSPILAVIGLSALVLGVGIITYSRARKHG